MAGEVVQLSRKRESGQEEAPALPHNDEVEQALLGALLVDNDVYDHLGGLSAEHFYDGLHAEIFAAAAKLIERGKPANAIALTPYFRDHPALSEMGEINYLVELQTRYVSIVSAPGYARTLMDLHRRREIIKAVTEANAEAARYDMDVTAEQIADSLSERLYRVQETGQQDRPLQTLGAFARTVHARTEAAQRGELNLEGVMTGLTELDQVLGGLQRSDFVVLASRPSMGKTSLAMQIAYRNALRRAEDGESGCVVLLHELEMSGEQLAERILAQRMGVASRTIARGRLSGDQRLDLMREAEYLDRLPLHVDDRPALTVQQVRNRARAVKRKHGLGLIVVDYLQLMGASTVRREANRVQEISEITAGLKALAKDLDVPVLALSQLSRAVEAREDKRPQLSDLRESGSIEQDADVVMFLYREAYYLKQAKPQESAHNYEDKLARWEERMEKARGVAEVIIAKHRHMGTGAARLFFNETSTSFINLQTDYQGSMNL